MKQPPRKAALDQFWTAALDVYDSRNPEPVSAGSSDRRPAESTRRKPIAVTLGDDHDTFLQLGELTVTGPGTRRRLHFSPHWQPIKLSPRLLIRWVPEKSDFVTPAERELAQIACLKEQGLTTKEIASHLSLNVRLVQRRIKQLLSFQGNTEKIVVTFAKERT